MRTRKGKYQPIRSSLYHRKMLRFLKQARDIKSKKVEKTNLPLNVGNNILFPKYIIIYLKKIDSRSSFKKARDTCID